MQFPRIAAGVLALAVVATAQAQPDPPAVDKAASYCTTTWPV